MGEIVDFTAEHLDGVMGLFAAERWSYASDRHRTLRALSAPGSLTLVALDLGNVVGVAQTVGDGELQAFLTVLIVAASHRRRGIGRALVQEAVQRTPGVHIDLISRSDGFYEALGFTPMSGFRLAREPHADR